MHLQNLKKKKFNPSPAQFINSDLIKTEPDMTLVGDIPRYNLKPPCLRGSRMRFEPFIWSCYVALFFYVGPIMRSLV